MNIDLQQLSKIEKRNIYLDYRAPICDVKALFSDGTQEYRNPSEPKEFEKVTLTLRTARGNVDQVYLVVDHLRYPMKVSKRDQLFDFYETQLELQDKRIEYYFEIYCGKVLCYYNAVGPAKELQSFYNFFIKPGFSTPDWMKGAVIYQIFVDRFANGDITNDVEDGEYFYIGDITRKVKEWNKYPASMGVREFYGGDLKGVLNKLDYLQDLGVEVIYLNPIFVSPSNHKYDIQDYDYIDPHFGVIKKDGGYLLQEGEGDNKRAEQYILRVTDKDNLEASNQLFITLTQEIHKRNMKVILDGVFNHCGSFNKWMDRERIYENQPGYQKGAYIDGESLYRSFFRFREEQWPYNGKYDGWWGHDTLPKLNYENSPLLVEYIMEIARKWVSPPYNADGWRLDVAADLGYSNEYNHEFWKEFRKNVKEANPNAVILAEHYGDPTDWLQGDQWDTVMNYDAFMEPITWFLTGVEKHSDEYREELLGSAQAFFSSMAHHMARFNVQSLQTSMNELSNHDHSRFLTRTNGRVGRTAYLGAEAAGENVQKSIMRLAVLMQMTWVGAPTIYYGDEAGVCGWTDPDNRRTFPWGQEDWDLINFHKEMIRIHKDYLVLKRGSLLFLTGQPYVISYGRFSHQEKMVMAVNRKSDKIILSVPVWKLGVVDGEKMVRLLLTTESGYDVSVYTYQVENGHITLELEGLSGVVIKNLEKF